MNTNDLRVIKTKKLLREILIEVLHKKTFNEITVVEICKLARINRSTFYAHYMNIDELFLEHFTNLIEELRADYNLVLENLDNPIHQSMTPLFTHIAKHRDFYDILLSENAPIKYLLQFNDYLVQFPLEVIIRNVSKDTDIDLFLSFCSSATMGMIYHWKKTGYKKTAEEMNYQLTKFFAKEY
ncbi:TetR/AcrR family transcriptional regulator [Peribacillus sp. NPDC097675]|uniref:TetR/AcrR family transcriptional regulator n=1 Tax=Peribacillus sp. NPDC097675 TaxID=3390618 RepID=UPI003D018AA3